MFKKNLLVASALLALSLPLIANANLETFNYTDEDSAVKIEKFNLCSGSLGKYTKRRTNPTTPGYLSTKVSEIKIMCGEMGDIKDCTATMYNTKDCTGDKVAVATLTLTGKTINVILKETLDQRYVVKAEGEKVEVRYRS